MSNSRISRIIENKASFEDRTISDLETLAMIVGELKERGLKIVLTQGVYDLLHEGHAKYLELAKSFGDVLVVGVDSDEFTKKRKGPNRPIVPQTERINMLLHLRHVDIVTVREDHHAIGDTIRIVKPDVLVTSSSTTDFTEQMKKEYGDFCKEIVTLSPQSTTSTTARIRNLTVEGAEKLASEVNKITQEFLKNIKSN